MLSQVLFIFFAMVIVLPVIYLIFTRNIIRAAFALVISLLGIAAIYVLLNAEYMAVVQILIYAGGVIVLLIFGIMLTKRIEEEGVFTGHRGVMTGVAASFGFLILLIKLIGSAAGNWEVKGIEPVNQVRQIGVLFLTDHIIAFELVAFILLVALVGAAFLAKKSSDI